MSYTLDLNDIQGNVVRAYGKYSYPFARYYFLNISNPTNGRAFVGEVASRVTTAARWPTKEARPKATVNIGFTFFGLFRLELPNRTLRALPEEFISGMKERAFLLGDRDQTVTEAASGDWCAHWDPIWRANRVGDGFDDDNVHIWISINAQRHVTPRTQLTEGEVDPLRKTIAPVPDMDETVAWLHGLCAAHPGVRILPGNGKDGSQDHHAAQAVFEEMDGVFQPTPKEHFGFADGIGDPVFAGQHPKEVEKLAVKGRGKRMGQGWQPLAPGEFLLGHPDESQELPPAAPPDNFMRNGTFMAYRKLHENVGTFSSVVAQEAARFARVQGISEAQADITLRAKMCGRWPDGIPLAKAPCWDAWLQVQKANGLDAKDPQERLANQVAYMRSPEASDFRYADDMPGFKTPPGAHLRRMNTRDYLDPLNKTGLDPATGKPLKNTAATTALNKRRRIMRRGLPYGPGPEVAKTDDTEQGVTMMLICASLFRQFEFVQQQWIQYGLDFHQGNDTCPLLGNHGTHKRMAIPADPTSQEQPYTMSHLKTFVECRGGEYFFIPSLTALRMIAMGTVDPT